MSPTSPIPIRSSGTNARLIPASLIEMESILESSILPPLSSSRRIEPLSTSCNPAIASRSSFCPLPEIPAIPRISPVLTERSTSSSVFTSSLSLQFSPSITRRFFTFSGFGRSIFRSTLAPTIISERLCTFAFAVSTVSMYCPFRRIATRSDKASTSCSLCVIMMIAHPSSRIFRKISNRRSASCGVSTAVGSSRISIFAPRYNIFTISTVCFSETDISYIFFERSRSKPYLFTSF